MKSFKFIFISILFAGAILFNACSPVSVKSGTGSITISLPSSGARDVVESDEVMAAWRNFAKESGFEIRLYDEAGSLIGEPVTPSDNNSYTFQELEPGKYVVSVMGIRKISHEDMQGTAASGEGKVYELMYPLGEERDGEDFVFSYLTGYGYCDVEVQAGKDAQAGIVIHPMNKVDNEYLPESVAGLLATKLTPSALFVKASGDDTTADGSFEKPYKTLKAAILNVNDKAKKDKENEIQNYAGYSIVVVGELTAEEGKSLLDLSDVELMEDLSVRIRGMGASSVLKGNGNRVINYTGASSLGLTLSNLTIKDGVAIDGNGGGINFAGTGWLSLNDCVITGNKTGNGRTVDSGLNGAGVYVGDGSSVSITNCIFKENVAMGDAGAVYGDGVSVMINGGLFEGNSSGRGGGAIYMNSGLLSVYSYYKDDSHARFVKNKSNGTGGTSYGGAIKINGNYDTNHSVSNAIFEGNEALGGGAICVQAGDIVVSDSQFTGNKATGEIGGGAIFIGGDGQQTSLVGSVRIWDCTVEETVLENNSANGAIYINIDSQLTLGGKVICEDKGVYINYSTEAGHYKCDSFTPNWEDNNYPIKLNSLYDLLDPASSISFAVNDKSSAITIGMISVEKYTDDILDAFIPSGSFALQGSGSEFYTLVLKQ